MNILDNSKVMYYVLGSFDVLDDSKGNLKCKRVFVS